MQDTELKSAAPDAGPEAVRTEGAQQAGYYGLQILPSVTAVVELAVMVGVLLIVDWIWPALDINNIQPSPYWVPVLLLTLQYGTASGTLAVIAAIIAYFSFVTLPEQGVGENEFAYRLRILSQPILWIGAAVILGQFRMVQISAKRELARRLRELETQRDTLAGYATGLRNRCDALERDIAARPLHAGPGLLDALAGLDAPAADPATAIERCLAVAFPGAAVSVFLAGDGSYRRALATGWPANATWLTLLPEDHKLTKAIAAARSRPVVLTPAGEDALAQQGLAAAPIVSARSGRVLGLIKLEQADSALLTSRIAAQLDILAAAIEPLLVESAAGATLKPTPRASFPEPQISGPPTPAAIPASSDHLRLQAGQ